MTTFDVKMGALAARLVTKYGKEISFADRESRVYDPATGKTEFPSIALTPVKSSPPFAYDAKWVDGDQIAATDTYVLLARELLPAGFTPTNGMDVVIDTVVFRVMSIGKLYSGDLVAAYQVQLRR